mmetsp:Transcript_76318/g.227463  ORF Transcript_76318/g.227463 Transcript_76318/m.227463 type:complete len:204 (-) Transcript_76318:1238-1849(-)
MAIALRGRLPAEALPVGGPKRPPLAASLAGGRERDAGVLRSCPRGRSVQGAADSVFHQAARAFRAGVADRGGRVADLGSTSGPLRSGPASALPVRAVGRFSAVPLAAWPGLQREESVRGSRAAAAVPLRRERVRAHAPRSGHLCKACAARGGPKGASARKVHRGHCARPHQELLASPQLGLPHHHACPDEPVPRAPPSHVLDV